MRYLFILYLLLSLLIPSAFLPAKSQSSLDVGKVSDLTREFKNKTARIQPAKIKQSVGAWVPYWDQPNVKRSLNKSKGLMNELSPYLYFVKSDGQLKPSAKFDMSTMKQAKKEGIKIIPMVSNDFDGQLISKIINNPKLRKAHINALADKVVKNNMDGIDLDYEGLLAKDRKMYAFFVKELSQKLHRHNKILSITLQAKVKEPGHTQATKAQNWQEIGKYADRLRIMAYDYHWKTSGPGPIAPKSWIDEIAKFARKNVPSRKIIIAIGTYGYNWESGRAQPITIGQAKQLSRKINQPIRRDPASHELFLRTGPGKPKIWLQDSGALKVKLDIVKKHDLGGVVFWRLGDEDPGTWEVVRNQLGS